jgi:glycine hydroxymethyltransferase
MCEALLEKGYALVSGGTDTHLLLVDLRSKNLTGKAAEEALQRAGITVNKNTIPGDPQSPFVTSGIRIGTPALTTRGMKEAEMRVIADLIDAILTSADEATVSRVAQRVRDLTASFPLYGRAPVPAPVA